MALVAYDVSDASEEEDIDEPIEINEPKINVQKVESNHGEKGETESSSKLCAVLPNPKSKPSIFISDLSRKLMLSSNGISLHAKKSVKIAVPSLNDLDEELPIPSTKKINAGSKGSGLFALLPPPKNSAVLAKENNLVPNSLKRKPPPQKAITKPAMKSLPKPVLAAPVAVEPIEEESDEEEDVSDFLGLKSKHEPDPDAIVEDVLIPEAPTELLEPPPETNPVHTDINIAYPSSSEFTPIENEELELDEEALQKLCGGSKRRRVNVQAQLIDVSEADVVPDKQEWMMKQMTEEKVVKRQSHKKNSGPSSQQKRKHQITYLAFQAKENEHELQSQWAQNRMTKKQTQSKYGF